jgi:hypothetical protein
MLSSICRMVLQHSNKDEYDTNQYISCLQYSLLNIGDLSKESVHGSGLLFTTSHALHLIGIGSTIVPIGISLTVTALLILILIARSSGVTLLLNRRSSVCRRLRLAIAGLWWWCCVSTWTSLLRTGVGVITIPLVAAIASIATSTSATSLLRLRAEGKETSVLF